MCNEFVTPQKNVLLKPQPNLTDEKSCWVYEVTFQNHGEKNRQYSLLWDAGGLSAECAESRLWESWRAQAPIIALQRMLHLAALLDLYSHTCLSHQSQIQIRSQRTLTCPKINLVLLSLKQNGNFYLFFQTTYAEDCSIASLIRLLALPKKILDTEMVKNSITPQCSAIEFPVFSRFKQVFSNMYYVFRCNSQSSLYPDFNLNHWFH